MPRRHLAHMKGERMTGLTWAEAHLMRAGFDDGFMAGLQGFSAARARGIYSRFREDHGFHGAADMLTSPDVQPKLGKSAMPTYGLMLTPAASLEFATFQLPRPVNACPMASRGCREACLAFAGHGQFTSTQWARQVRHGFLLAHPVSAGILIGAEARKAVQRSGEIGLRLNVITDYRWEAIAPIGLRHAIGMGVRPYDYTAYRMADRAPMAGYHLTRSAKESTSDAEIIADLSAGINVAVPFATRKGEALPASFLGFPVIDGDLSDDRTRDPRGVIVGLRAKGTRGKSDASGFVRSI